MAEKRSGTRPKAFQPMSQAQLEALFSRDLRILPHAEQFLECRDPAVRKPFVYSAVSAFPVPYCLHKCELLARRWLRRS
jgi:hypothetical protein